MDNETLKVRCYAQRDSDGSWFAICLDLNLYARADTQRKARRQLERIVCQYVAEAYGRDREHLHDLIPRRAPARFWARYWAARLLGRILPNGDRPRPFSEDLPLKPARA